MTARIATAAAQADGTIAPEPTFDARQVSQTVAMMGELLFRARVQIMTLAATSIPFIGRV